jgi:hypothetical protein
MKKDKKILANQDIETEDALKLKRVQDKVRKKFDFLSEVDAQHFQCEYIKAQAEEICNYLQYLRLTPFRSWYSKHLKMVSDSVFMHDHFLVKNEFEEIVPDLDRINSLVLSDVIDEDNHLKERDY